MSYDSYPEIAPSFFAKFDPASMEFTAGVDGKAHTAELHDVLYERVMTWTALYGVVLGEGYTHSWPGGGIWPATLTLRAPVISSAIDKKIVGFFLEDGSLED